jgi:hypothetical protein
MATIVREMVEKSYEIGKNYIMKISIGIKGQEYSTNNTK